MTSMTQDSAERAAAADSACGWVDEQLRAMGAECEVEQVRPRGPEKYRADVFAYGELLAVEWGPSRSVAVARGLDAAVEALVRSGNLDVQ